MTIAVVPLHNNNKLPSANLVPAITSDFIRQITIYFRTRLRSELDDGADRGARAR